MNHWAMKPAFVLALLASALPGSRAAAQVGAARGPARASYASVGGPTSVPSGWADFCRRYAGECDIGPLAPAGVN
ncbi:MAG: transglutaminase-like cysteine peptidase, partial [Methylocella sp.]